MTQLLCQVMGLQLHIFQPSKIYLLKQLSSKYLFCFSCTINGCRQLYFFLLLKGQRIQANADDQASFIVPLLVYSFSLCFAYLLATSTEAVYMRYLWLHNKLTQNLAAGNISYFIVSVVQEPRHALAVSCVSENQGGAAVISRVDWGKICFKLTCVVAGRIQFLAGCWSADLSSSLAVGQRLPSLPCHTDLSVGRLRTWQFASSESR